MAMCRHAIFRCRSAVLSVANKRCSNLSSTLPPSASKPQNTSDSTAIAGDTEADIVSAQEMAFRRRSHVIGSEGAKKELVDNYIVQLSHSITAYRVENEMENFDKLMLDSTFRNTVEELQKFADSMTSGQIVHCLSLLLTVCPEQCLTVINLLENQALKLMQHGMSVPQLIKLVQLYGNTNTKMGFRVRKEAWSALKRRWVEISSGKDIVSLLISAPTTNDTRFLERIENRTLELCDSLNSKELYRIFYALARRQRRSAPLLRAIVYHLARQELSLGPVHLSNLAYSLAVLNVHNAEIMDKITAVAIASVKEQNNPNAIVTMLSSLVQSFGVLRRRDTKLLDAAASFFLEHQSLVTPENWHQLLYTVAWVDYLPVSLGTSGIMEVGEMISKTSLAEDTPLGFLDFVWSCSVLSSVSPKLAAMALDSTFVSSVTTAGSANLVPTYMKLMNINSCVQMHLPDYSGPLLSQTFIDKSMAEILPRHRDELFNSVFEAMSQMAPAEQYLRTDVKTVTGHVVDIEMLVDGNAVPKPLSTPSSADIHRVAVLLHNFADLTSGTGCPTGALSLVARLLTGQGYKVVQIPYTEFDVFATVVKRVQYLHQKLKDAVTLSATTAKTSQTSPVDKLADGVGDRKEDPKTETPRIQVKTMNGNSVGRDAKLKPKGIGWGSTEAVDTAASKVKKGKLQKSADGGKSNDSVSSATAKDKKPESSRTKPQKRAALKVKLDVNRLFTEELDEK